MLVVLRMALAGLALGGLFLATGGMAEVRQSGRARRLVLVGMAVTFELLFFFASIKLANVTIAVSLEYMAPVYVAIVAPLVFGTARRGLDMAATAIAVVGMAIIVLPSFTFDGPAGVWGIVFGLLAGIMFATAMMLVKSIGRDVRGSTIALFFCLASVVLLTPLAAWQAIETHYQFTGGDALIIIVNGLVYTALCFSLFTDGIRHVPVEHAGILGYIEPVSAPLWAFLFIGEQPPLTALVGGALIVTAGVLIVALGRNRAETPLIEPIS